MCANKACGRDAEPGRAFCRPCSAAFQMGLSRSREGGVDGTAIEERFGWLVDELDALRTYVLAAHGVSYPSPERVEGLAAKLRIQYPGNLLADALEALTAGAGYTK